MEKSSYDVVCAADSMISTCFRCPKSFIFIVYVPLYLYIVVNPWHSCARCYSSVFVCLFITSSQALLLKLYYLFHSEEEKCLLVKVSIPRMSSDQEEPFRQVNMLSVSVEYFDALNSCMRENIAAAYVTQTQKCKDPLPAANRRRLVLQQFRTQVANCMEQAAKLADLGRYKDARDLLDVTLAQIKRSEVRDDDLAVYLIQTLVDCLAGMEDKGTYENKGKPTLKSYAHSHWQQRSNCSTQGVREYYYGMEDEFRLLNVPTVTVSPRATAHSSRSITGMKQKKAAAPYRNAMKSDMMERYVSPSCPSTSPKVHFSDRVSVMESSIKPKANSTP